MIASQKIGKSFIGALKYNLKKLDYRDPAKRAELLETNFSSLNTRQMAFEVELLRNLRPSLNKYVYHTSLNFHNNDKLNNEMLLSIAHDYLEAMGFTNNQYFIFRHHDADHGHLHLLVNRITFDGGVISDSNNYKRSEEVLRAIEIQNNLLQVNPSQSSQLRAATKDEIEKVIRTGSGSDKLVLQEKMKTLISKSQTLSELIANGEKAGIYFLFNQQSTGRISGITYFFEDFKIKGQKLGNRFKWVELVNVINYEQDRDSKTISEANSRTKAKYGDFTKPDEKRSTGQGVDRLFRGDTDDSANEYRQPTATEEFGDETYPDRERSLAADQDADRNYRDTADTMYHDNFDLDIQISDDIDDEAVYGKKRNRKDSGRYSGR